MAHRRLLAAFLVVATLLLIGLIFTDWLPYLRGPAPATSEWYWPHQLRPFDRWWAPVLAALALLGISAWWLGRTKAKQWHTVTAIIGLMAASLLLQLALVYADRPDVAAELVDRTLSNLESGFFEPAAAIDNVHAVLRAYPQAMPGFVSEHARTHPPGLILANWLTIQALAEVPDVSAAIARHVWPLRCTDLWLLNRPASVAAALAAWAILPMVAAALTAIPAYLLARRLLPSATVRLATIMTATVPALLLFAPKSVQLYAPLSLVALLALHTGLERRALPWLFLSGLTLSVATFLSLGNAALFLLLGIYTLLFIYQQRPRKLAYSQTRKLAYSQTRKLANSQTRKLANSQTRPLAHSPTRPLAHSPTHLVAFTLGVLSLWLIYWLGWGVPPWQIFQTGLQQHYDLVTLQRRYEWWLFYNLIDLLVYTGLPLLAGFIGAVALAIQNLRRERLNAAGALALALLLLILALDLSGSARGEVGRLWLFFMPLLALAGAAFLARTLPGARAAMILVALQLAITVSLGLAWQPVRAVIVVAQRPPMPATSAENRLDVSFRGEPISLHGYTLEASPAQLGDYLDLTLYWNAAGPALRPYTVFNHLLDNERRLVAQQDNWPVNGQWPPTCWRAGDTIVDTYRIELPADLPPGAYTLFTGLYDAADGSRLTTTTNQDAVRLTPITIAPEFTSATTRDSLP